MINPRNIDYVRQNIGKYSPDSIRQALLKGGLSEADAVETMRLATEEAPPIQSLEAAIPPPPAFGVEQRAELPAAPRPSGVSPKRGMDKNSMLLLGMVKLVYPETKETQLVEVKGFDVLGFFFPFLRLLIAGMWGKLALFCVTFFVYPVWCWYIGFNFKRMQFEALLASGWVMADEAD